MAYHSRTVRAKQEEREHRIAALPPQFHKSLSRSDKDILNLPISELNARVTEGKLDPVNVVTAYGKRALEAHSHCNALTEIMLGDAVSKWARESVKGPLHGVPVSLKDTNTVKGYDVSLGFSRRCFQPSTFDSPLVSVIRAAGGIPYVKTNIPLTLLSFESYNDVWGITDNPHVSGYAPGGSSGGEAALIAFGGSRVGVGSDIAGSVRLPAHFSGIYALRPTTTRFPRAKTGSAMSGQEGIVSVNGPMARSLDDLIYFFKAIIDTKPWEFDYQVTEMPWKHEDKIPAKLKFGVLSTDTIVDPSPACARALKLTVDAVRKQGYEVVEFGIPDPLEALAVGSQLLCSDGLEVTTSQMVWGETQDAGVQVGWLWTRVPKFLRKLWAFGIEYFTGDNVWATLLRGFGRKTVAEQWALVERREKYRGQFYDAFKASGIDFLLTVPNATPAIPHRGLANSWASCLYTFLFNIVDYPAGVLPVTKVDRTIDKCTQTEWPNQVAKRAFHNYNADKMHGLPVGVQIVGRRFREEQLLQAMQVVEKALHASNVFYKQIEI